MSEEQTTVSNHTEVTTKPTPTVTTPEKPLTATGGWLHTLGLDWLTGVGNKDSASIASPSTPTKLPTESTPTESTPTVVPPIDKPTS